MKNLGGRPLKFKTVEEIQEKIDSYFEYCDNRIRTIYSEKTGDDIQISNPEPYTMSGLAYELDISRQALINYKNRSQGFMDTIKRARRKVEVDVERRMNDKNTFTPGLIFNAKNNFGWKDQTETDITSKGEKLEAPTVFIPQEK